MTTPYNVTVTGTSARVVTVGTQGPAGPTGPRGSQGPAGPSGAHATGVCGESVGDLNVIVALGGLLYKADPTNVNHNNFVVGVAASGAGVGETIEYVQVGNLVGSFIADKKYFCGPAGSLSTSYIETGFVWTKCIGSSNGASELIVNMLPSILL